MVIRKDIEELARSMCARKGVDPDGFQLVHYPLFYAKPHEHNGRGRSEMARGSIRNWEAHAPLAHNYLTIARKTTMPPDAWFYYVEE